MMRHFTTISLLALATVAIAAGDASAKLAKNGDANVAFTATGPGGLKIVGTTAELTVADDGQNVSITVPLRALDTKIELRNKHMRDKYLEVDKYPNAVLVVPRAELKMPQGADVAGDAAGTMKLHGKDRPVRFHYTAKRVGTQLAVSGTVRLNIKEYGIEEPSFMGASVKPDVDVAAGFSVTDN